MYKIVPEVMRLGDLFCKEKKIFSSLEFEFNKFSVYSASTPKGLLFIPEISRWFRFHHKTRNILWLIKQVYIQFMQQINHLNFFYRYTLLVWTEFYDEIVEQNCTFKRHQELFFSRNLIRRQRHNFVTYSLLRQPL